MHPDSVERLRARGEKPRNPLANLKSRGKKLAPQGQIVPSLTLDAEQRVVVLFVDFPEGPTGGPADRRPLTDFDDMLFGTTYDPPDYAAYGAHPTDRTLKNYFSEVSYGAVNVSTLNLPSETGWIMADHPYSYYSRGDGVHDNGFGPYPENVLGLLVADSCSQVHICA